MSTEDDERPVEDMPEDAPGDTADDVGTRDDAHVTDSAHEPVRALLAAAADPADEQVPEDVAGRLDDVLAGLVSERAGRGATGDDAADGPEATDHPMTGASSLGESAHSGTASVTALASRRRRRWVQGLAAAAAVSVVGVGLGTVLADGNGEGSAASSGASAESGAAADSVGGATDQGAESADEGLAAGTEPEVAPRSQEPRPDQRVRVLSARPPRLHTGSLTVDVQRIEDFVLAVPVAESERAWRQACVRPSTGPGDAWLPVLLDGERGVLLLRAPAGGRRTAQVYTCGDPTDPVAETTVESR